jgi:hypothetical protein
MTLFRYAVVLFGFIVLAGAARAEAQVNKLAQVLQDAKTVECEYTVMGTGDWPKGTPTMTSAPASLKVVYRNVDTSESSAEIESTAKESFYIVVRYVGDYLHLMQMKSEGPVYTTTVYAREVRPGRLLSVHTRHEYTAIRLPGYTSRPEQYFGDCAVS